MSAQNNVPLGCSRVELLVPGGMPRFTAAVAAAANMAQYLSQQNHANGPMKAHAGPLVDRTHLYWPGLQGLVANPMAWRDRLGSSKYALVVFAFSCCVRVCSGSIYWQNLPQKQPEGQKPFFRHTTVTHRVHVQFSWSWYHKTPERSCAQLIIGKFDGSP